MLIHKCRSNSPLFLVFHGGPPSIEQSIFWFFSPVSPMNLCQTNNNTSSNQKHTTMASTQLSSSMKATKREKSCKPRKGKGPQKPKRALTAYNLYTALCRERIRKGIPLQLPATVDDVTRISVQNKLRKRREHRKTSPGMSFEVMSQLIITQWKNLPSDQRTLFELEADLLKEEREVALAQWKVQVQSQQEQQEYPPEVSLDSSRASSPSWSLDGQNTRSEVSWSSQLETTYAIHSSLADESQVGETLESPSTLEAVPAADLPFDAISQGNLDESRMNLSEEQEDVGMDDSLHLNHPDGSRTFLSSDDLPSFLTEDLEDAFKHLLGNDARNWDRLLEQEDCLLLGDADHLTEPSFDHLAEEAEEPAKAPVDKLSAHLDRTLLDPMDAGDMETIFAVS